MNTSVFARPVLLSSQRLAALVFAAAAAITLAPSAPAHAQSTAAARGLPDFSDLVEQVGPSVVNIRTTERVTARGLGNLPGGLNEEEMLEQLRRLFGDRLPIPERRGTPPGGTPPAPTPDEPAPRNAPRGVGSGFIITSDGFVMTNAHVVKDATEVLVTLTDKREFKAKVIGADDRTDVAVLKIEATGLPAVKIGDSGRLRVGEWVMAIGSPFGLESSVTAGIVSAKQRETGNILPYIQTDVAINPGNSGGPLLNLRGEVVGINSWIITQTGGSVGLSFSIPVNDAMRVSEQLRAGGKVQRGRLGIAIGEVSKELAESIGLSKAQGVLVRRVEPGLGAEKAGIEAGDVLTKINGTVLEKSVDLQRLVFATKPGTPVAVTLMRRGKEMNVKVTLSELDETTAAATPERAPTPKAAEPASEVLKGFGLALAEPTDKQKTELKIKGGARVAAASGAAARAGLRERDVITQVQNTEVGSSKEAEAALSKTDRSKPINVLYRRGEWASYAVIAPAK